MTGNKEATTMPDMQRQAEEYASDQIPAARDGDGFATFYRRDLVEAYLTGAKMQKSLTAPLALVEPTRNFPMACGYDVQMAAATYRNGRYKSHGAPVQFEKEDVDAAFMAGVAWSRERAAARLERRDWKPATPFDQSAAYTSIMAMLQKINEAVIELHHPPKTETDVFREAWENAKRAERDRGEQGIKPPKGAVFLSADNGVPGEGEV